MSHVPMLFSDWWDDFDNPHVIYDQHFGLPIDPENLVHHRGGITNRHNEHLGYPFFRRMRRRHHPFHHALVSRRNYTGNKGTSIMQADRDKFFVTLDVQQFAPDEITVKTIDRSIIVEAKHEEKEDEHGLISRQFLRKYMIPLHCDIEQIESSLSSDGVLTITAPRKKPLNAEGNERTIKIQYTGEPAIFDRREIPSRMSEGHGSEDSSHRDQLQQRGQMIQQRGKKVTVKGA